MAAGSPAADQAIHDAFGLAGHVLPYTTSETAARTLLPPGFEILPHLIGNPIYAGCRRAGLNGGLPYPHHGQWGATPALALCGAIMRAHAQLVQGKDKAADNRNRPARVSAGRLCAWTCRPGIRPGEGYAPATRPECGSGTATGDRGAPRIAFHGANAAAASGFLAGVRIRTKSAPGGSGPRPSQWGQDLRAISVQTPKPILVRRIPADLRRLVRASPIG